MDPPGTFYNYANPNFALAGLALERAGGVSYRQAVANRVLSPLGMKRTLFFDPRRSSRTEISATVHRSRRPSRNAGGGSRATSPRRLRLNRSQRRIKIWNVTDGTRLLGILELFGTPQADLPEYGVRDRS
jgi:CubicO group peptidase (beta-lactamase class C family)